MDRSRTFLAVGALLTAVFFAGAVSPATASPVGTNFFWSASNFQGDTLGEVVPFGVPTPTDSGMIVDSHATSLPGDIEFLDFWFTTENGGYLASNLLAESEFLISGINWGAGAPPAVAVGLLYISFDSNGQFLDLLEDNALMLPILPHPITGQDSLVLDVDGAPADAIPFDVDIALGVVLGQILVEGGTPNILAVNSMHVGFAVAHIPEPASAMLVATGLAGLCLVRRRRAR